MDNFRIIPRLDVKAPYLVKGIQLEGLRQIGNPVDFAKKYFIDGADELLYMDIVASLFERNQLHDIISDTAQDIFIPIAVGGGIRSVGDAINVLNSGADKVTLNTAAIRNPEIIKKLADKFGGQSIVLSIEAKKKDKNHWECYTDNGREITGRCVIDWAKDAIGLGAGEILLTSVDRDGTRSGFDIDLISKVSNCITVPLIASGGMGQLSHLKDLYNNSSVAAVAIGSVFHYGVLTIQEVKEFAQDHGIPVRGYNECLYS